jgi:hypothetical protein
VQEVNAHSVLYGDLWITTAIDDRDGILVGLRIVHHEAFEVWLFYAVFFHEFIEFSPHNTLDNRVLRLHVPYSNVHDLAIRCIVCMMHHCGPCLDTLDMVKHELCIL